LKWEETALVLNLTGRVPAGGGPATSFNVRRMMRIVGDTLVVQGTMNQAGKVLDVATVYKRSPDAIPAPKPAAAFTGPAATIADAAWIGGVWSGPNGSTTVEERWTPAASGGMIGVGRTLRGAALASFEFLCIAERNGTLVYAAMPDARFPATFFTLSNITPTSATFENPSHDFPEADSLHEARGRVAGNRDQRRPDCETDDVRAEAGAIEDKTVRSGVRGPGSRVPGPPGTSASRRSPRPEPPRAASGRRRGDRRRRRLAVAAPSDRAGGA
jgi:hypothetical protein